VGNSREGELLEILQDLTISVCAAKSVVSREAAIRAIKRLRERGMNYPTFANYLGETVLFIATPKEMGRTLRIEEYLLRQAVEAVAWSNYATTAIITGKTSSRLLTQFGGDENLMPEPSSLTASENGWHLNAPPHLWMGVDYPRGAAREGIPQDAGLYTLRITMSLTSESSFIRVLQGLIAVELRDMVWDILKALGFNEEGEWTPPEQNKTPRRKILLDEEMLRASS
jgi:hypothetical protein